MEVGRETLASRLKMTAEAGYAPQHNRHDMGRFILTIDKNPPFNQGRFEGNGLSLMLFIFWRTRVWSKAVFISNNSMSVVDN